MWSDLASWLFHHWVHSLCSGLQLGRRCPNLTPHPERRGRTRSRRGRGVKREADSMLGSRFCLIFYIHADTTILLMVFVIIHVLNLGSANNLLSVNSQPLISILPPLPPSPPDLILLHQLKHSPLDIIPSTPLDDFHVTPGSIFRISPSHCFL